MLTVPSLISFWNILGKKSHQGLLLIFTTWVFLSPSAFAEEQEICDVLTPWDLPVCATTDKERTRKSDLLHTLLAESFRRKKILPEKVKESGQAVFNIGVQRTFEQWSLNFSGASGFFMFDNRSFFTNHHVLESLLSKGISNWNEVVFKDQKGEEEDFQIKGVKFLSKMHDVAVFEVEGYEGTVLEPAERTPGEQSYIIGYSPEFKIQSVYGIFEPSNTKYGALIELFDCCYNFNFAGASGGPMVNQKGKVESIFSNMFHSGLNSCAFLITRKLNHLMEEIKKSTEIFDSIPETEDLIEEGLTRFAQLALSGDLEARFSLWLENVDPSAYPEMTYNPKTWISDAAAAGNLFARHFTLDEMMNKNLPIDSWEKSQWMAQTEKLHITWYEMGSIAYYIHNNFKKACDFWKKAAQLGHPFIHENFVFIPYAGDIINCEL